MRSAQHQTYSGPITTPCFNAPVRAESNTESTTVLPPNARRLVQISGPKGRDLILPDRDLMFEPSTQAATFYAHVMDSGTRYVLAENSTGLPIALPKNSSVTQKIKLLIVV